MTVSYPVRNCIWCGEGSTVEVEQSEYDLLMSGEHVQNVFPTMDAGKRELLISGTHPECWDRFMGDEEDDDE